MMKNQTTQSQLSLYKSLFELSPIATAIFNTDEQCQVTNRSFCTQLGYERDELYLESFRLSNIFDNPAQAEKFLELTKQKTVIRHYETQLKTKEGNPFPALISSRVLMYFEQDGLEVSFTNIKQQKNLQRALKQEHTRVTSLIDNLTAGLFLVNNSGMITEANQALGNLVNLEPKSLITQNYQILFGQIISIATEPDLTQRWLSNAVLNVREKPSTTLTIRNQFISYLELALFPVWDDQGQILGWGGLIQDITEMKEQATWKLELMSILAHDIRAPLATLKGHATALLANHQQWSTDMVSEFLESINRGVDDLVRQVDRNLALTRVETGQLGIRPQETQITTLVQQAIERASGAIDGVTVKEEIPEKLPNIRVDPARVEEVLVNLLDNASRYTPSGKPITIRVTQLDDWLQISVMDQGPGIPKEKQSTIFEKYVHGVQEEGTGLGLYICRKIIDSHGGRIWIESPIADRDHGTIIHFTLPLMPEKIVEKLGEQSPSAVISKEKIQEARVLVVEDEADIQVLLHTILTQEGYQVEIAPDGLTALDLFQTSPPEIVLLDWLLPGMSGLNICRNIRRWSNVPIIIVTSKTAQEDLITALDAGADDYVTKPFLGDELLARIRALLRRREPQLIDTELQQFSEKGFFINFDARQAWLNGVPLELTPTEYELLAYLVNHRGQVLTYDQLIAHIWGSQRIGNRHNLFVHISRLREKIESDPKEPRFLHTRWGTGYLFMPE
jgi:two-component system response regulator RegX3